MAAPDAPKYDYSSMTLADDYRLYVGLCKMSGHSPQLPSPPWRKSATTYQEYSQHFTVYCDMFKYGTNQGAVPKEIEATQQELIQNQKLQLMEVNKTLLEERVKRQREAPKVKVTKEVGASGEILTGTYETTATEFAKLQTVVTQQNAPKPEPPKVKLHWRDHTIINREQVVQLINIGLAHSTKREEYRNCDDLLSSLREDPGASTEHIENILDRYVLLGMKYKDNPVYAPAGEKIVKPFGRGGSSDRGGTGFRGKPRGGRGGQHKQQNGNSGSQGRGNRPQEYLALD
jgi:hypothetical protein